MQVYNEDQERLKEQLLRIFETEDTRTQLLVLFKSIINDGLLVNLEVVPNPSIYRCLREALESRSIYVPDIVQVTQSVSFIAKPVIAAIWSRTSERVTRDPLLLEYHKMRQEVVNFSKDYLAERLSQSLSPEFDAPSASSSQQAGHSNAPRHFDEAFAESERTLALLNDEEIHVTPCGDKKRVVRPNLKATRNRRMKIKKVRKKIQTSRIGVKIMDSQQWRRQRPRPQQWIDRKRMHHWERDRTVAGGSLTFEMLTGM